MELTPESYHCDTHDLDLTDFVREMLEERVAVAYGRKGPSPFEVLVTCPGGGSHRVVASGTVKYPR